MVKSACQHTVPTKAIQLSTYLNFLLGEGVLCHIAKLSPIGYEAVVRPSRKQSQPH